METLRNIRLFLKVVQTGSFSAAGRVIGLSPASVSRQMNALEQALGIRLIYRTSRKLTLTEVGQLYYERASDIIQEFDTLESIVSEHQTKPRGLLHVHTRVAIGTRLLASALPAFYEHFPDIRVKLWLTEEPRDLIEHKIDVAIRLGNLDEPSLAVRKLWNASRRIIFASPVYLANSPKLDHPDDVLKHRCLTYLDGRFDDGSALWRFRDKGGIREIRVTGPIQVNNPELVRECALAHMGLGLLPKWSIWDELQSGRLVEVLPSWPVSPGTFDHNIYAVYERSRYVPLKVRTFVNFLVGFFANRKDGATSITDFEPLFGGQSLEDRLHLETEWSTM
ncbi:LysR family transcriptional regulator [Bradyrhizobium sp. LHD-71]|uniref:LysR family transcriptional regulator n=1 Tax=Bradyrhizobium sp. LHD-71 TaxID=3072141 RepID=UPI00280CC04B|nr:LysR family transcriptional regulator [Bradyrhizobium sp. LHD-71]MDQ8727185.1 LysR family transcriptional regulator [Bradyrhizobium sp. LHD-71]